MDEHTNCTITELKDNRFSVFLYTSRVMQECLFMPNADGDARDRLHGKRLSANVITLTYHWTA